MSYDATPDYERENWLENRLSALLKPILGKFYGTKAPGSRFIHRFGEIVSACFSSFQTQPRAGATEHGAFAGAAAENQPGHTLAA